MNGIYNLGLEKFLSSLGMRGFVGVWRPLTCGNRPVPKLGCAPLARNGASAAPFRANGLPIFNCIQPIFTPVAHLQHSIAKQHSMHLSPSKPIIRLILTQNCQITAKLYPFPIAFSQLNPILTLTQYLHSMVHAWFRVSRFSAHASYLPGSIKNIML